MGMSDRSTNIQSQKSGNIHAHVLRKHHVTFGRWFEFWHRFATYNLHVRTLRAYGNFHVSRSNWVNSLSSESCCDTMFDAYRMELLHLIDHELIVYTPTNVLKPHELTWWKFPWNFFRWRLTRARLITARSLGAAYTSCHRKVRDDFARNPSRGAVLFPGLGTLEYQPYAVQVRART